MAAWFAVWPVVFTRRTSVLFIFMASAPPVSAVGPRFSWAFRPPRTALVGGAPGSTALVAAAPGASSAAIPATIIIVARETARRIAFLGLHLVRGLSVPLGELDFDLTPTNPFVVQVVKSILCIPDIFKLNVSKSSCPSCIEVKGNVDIYNRPITTKLTS